MAMSQSLWQSVDPSLGNGRFLEIFLGLRHCAIQTDLQPNMFRYRNGACTEISRRYTNALREALLPQRRCLCRNYRKTLNDSNNPSN